MGLEYEKNFSRQTNVGELTSAMFWREVLIEALACCILMIFVILILITNNEAAYVPNVFHFGLFAGFLVYLLIEGYGPISGAHMNPAASFALCAAGHITPVRAIAYIAAQVGGTAAGAFIGLGLTPESKRANFPSLQPTPLLTDVQCVMLEACLTFNLLFVAISMADTKNRPSATVLPSLPVAFCIGVGILAAGTHTGGLQNPIVPLGPAFLNLNFNRHWIYWLGPFMGGTCGAFAYELAQFIKRRFSLGSHAPTVDRMLSILKPHPQSEQTSSGGHEYTGPARTFDNEHHYEEHPNGEHHQLHHHYIDVHQKKALVTDNV